MVSKRDRQRSWAEAMFRAAEVFEEMKDTRSAFKCLSVGAGLNDTACQLNLGNFYAAGIGTRKNLRRAEYWYKKAYQAGNVTAAFNLAIDRKRMGDVKSAISWLKKAIAKHDGNAFVALAEIYAKQAGGREKAVELLRRALDLNSDQISEDGREQAMSLLKKFEPARPPQLRQT